MGSTGIYDVIVIGAGLSGLQAAVNVQKAGLSCLVIEACDRIGGKVLSIPNFSGSNETVDVGPAWINDTSQSYIWALAQKYSLEFEKQIHSGFDLVESVEGHVSKMSSGDIPGTAEQLQHFGHLAGLIDDMGERVMKENFSGKLSKELDQLNFMEWIKTNSEPDYHPYLLSVMDTITQGILGFTGDELSALYMIKYIASGTGFTNIVGHGKDGGQYLRPYSGSISYVNALASELKENSIITSTPVSTIEQNGNYCTVTSPSKDTLYEAKKVILAIPSSLYHHIDFTPDLPPIKQELIKSSKMAYYTKVVLVYSTPWWRAAGLSGLTQSTSKDGPISVVYDTCIETRRQYSLSLFILGPSGKKWSELSEDRRRQTALDHVRHLFGSFVEDDIPEPLNVIEREWAKEPYFEGAPCPVYPPGLLTSDANSGGTSLFEPVGHLHFVSTETSDVWTGYMEGALRSGERGANEVVASLRR